MNRPPNRRPSSGRQPSGTASDSRPSPIEARDVASGFVCGQRDLDDFFARHSLGNDAAGICRTFVLRNSAQRDASVLGFYTLSMATIDASLAAERLKRRLPRYPMPVALLGRLAVHRLAQGKGVGSILVYDALENVALAATSVGCLGVIVDAKDESARTFYAKFGFEDLAATGWPRRMYLPIETVRRLTSEQT